MQSSRPSDQSTRYPAWTGPLHGIVPVIPTPFHASGEIDFNGLRHLVEFAADCKVKAVCLPAYGSEFYKLSETERAAVVKTAVEQASGRVLVVAQSNHPSSWIAAEIARKNQDLGADVISFALPRQFSISENDQLRFAEFVARSVSTPVLIQDFNPGGPTAGAEFATRLSQSAPNFAYLKLEEPMMGPKVKAITEATRGRVGVLEGWGGMHLLELMPIGICGAMPGLAMCDLFQDLTGRVLAGDDEGAWHIFRIVLPFIVYSLQNMELFHHCEKRLLVKRGLIRDPVVREPALTLDAAASAYVDRLIGHVLAGVESLRATTLK
jgi:4-hydroxy-tetrahydrodipicolinate synthase